MLPGTLDLEASGFNSLGSPTVPRMLPGTLDLEASGFNSLGSLTVPRISMGSLNRKLHRGGAGSPASFTQLKRITLSIPNYADKVGVKRSLALNNNVLNDVYKG